MAPPTISIHALLAESDAGGHQEQNGVLGISIHALLAESDAAYINNLIYTINEFLSTLSLRRATAPRRGISACHRDFYPRSPCGERLPRCCTGTTSADFYPRSPCGERRGIMSSIAAILAISIHALLAESDAYGRINDISRLIFLSTLSLRRATVGLDLVGQMENISIHALLAESDHFLCTSKINMSNFYPRSPCGERPYYGCQPPPYVLISIHALLAESDWTGGKIICRLVYFYPRSPCGERLHSGGPWQAEYMDFYPRSPCGERPNNVLPAYAACGISIHALLAESDRASQSYSLAIMHFYPRSPCGERLPALNNILKLFAISIHALLAESDAPSPPRREF